MLMYKDYLTKVSKPMDFGTIKARLEGGAYAMDTEKFTADMRQVFENAFLYNAPGSDVHSMAKTLKVGMPILSSLILCHMKAMAIERESS